jgi:CheY-like chemotaxis protein
VNFDAPRTNRVLYVEDAFDQALLVKAFFKALPGYTVVHSQDGDHALKLVADESWDLLVTDLNLPGADGFAVVRQMRAHHPDAPILVTTGYTQAQYEEQALRAGADQVMIKPLTQTDFVGRVESMVTRARAGEETEATAGDVILAIEGRIGDVEMGCGGTLMRAAESGAKVVILPLLGPEHEDTPSELKAASIAVSILGLEFRVDRTLHGERPGQRDLLERTINELRPTTVYLPAPDDRDEDRRLASEMGLRAAAEIPQILGYETATTGLDFTPSHFSDVRSQMVMKMEALAAYQSVGAPRVDLRPRMAQAYARYWGRFREFGEVEAFQEVRP